MARKRKLPLRKCIVTGEMKQKKDLIRVVRNKAGDIFVDETGKQNGRGAYLSIDESVIKKAKETKTLDSLFKRAIDPNIYEELARVVSDKLNDK